MLVREGQDLDFCTDCFYLIYITFSIQLEIELNSWCVDGFRRESCGKDARMRGMADVDVDG